MRKYFVFVTNDKDSGNAACVMLNATMIDADMQKAAFESKSPATVFISAGTKHPLIRCFYPDMEAPLCVHGVLAGAKALLENQPDSTLLLETKESGILSFVRDRQTGVIKLKLSKQSAPSLKPDALEIAGLLNLDSVQAIENSLPFGVFSVGSPKLLVPLRSFHNISTLQPNFGLIKAWSIQNNVNGLYVYMLENETIVARNFNPKTGIWEDSGTGVAAGALCLALKRNLVIDQGQFIQCPSKLFATYESDEVIWVGGVVSEST